MSFTQLKPHVVMGILNLTPDSFSDGGLYTDPAKAADHARQMADEGAGIIDMGAESTRPGSLPVPPEDQIKRLLPVLRKIQSSGGTIGAAISIDTRSSEVAEVCLQEGANIINDISALRDAHRLLSVVAKFNAGLILMHMQGDPQTMQRNPYYADVVCEVRDFLSERAHFAQSGGVNPAHIYIDPGFGFGKSFDHNLELLRRLNEITAQCPWPLVAGVSRKSFLGKICGEKEPSSRLGASVAAGLAAISRGAAVLRVHDVAAHVQAIKIATVISTVL